MKSRQIIEAINVGDNPDWLDPGKRRSIERRENPYTKHPAMGHSEQLAGEGYQEVLRKVARYTGLDPRQVRGGPRGLGTLMFQALERMLDLQAGHEEELEQLAIRTVLGMDEFELAREAVEAGELRIEAVLTQNVNLEGAREEAEDMSDKEEMQIAQVARELDLETAKRRFVNMLIQGNAMSKSYAFHLVNDELNAISPQLVNLYGVLTSISELGHYIFPDEMQAAMRGAEGAGGAARIRIGEDGVPILHAEADAFPTLIHELVKVLMEYLSYSEEDDPETRAHAMSQADTLSDEPMALMLGPGAWRRVVALVPADKQRMLPYIYDYIVRLPPEQFDAFMTEVQQGSARARRTVENLVREIENEGMEESRAARIVNRMLS